MTKTITATHSGYYIPTNNSRVFYHNQNESTLYEINYSEVFSTNETIVTSEWKIVENEQLNRLSEISLSSPSVNVNRTYCRISTTDQIAEGYSYLIYNTIETNFQNRFTRYFVIRISGVREYADNWIQPEPNPDDNLDNEIISVPFVFNEVSPKVIAVLNNRYINRASIQVTVPTNGINSGLQLGTVGDPALLIPANMNDFTEVGFYRTSPGIMTGNNFVITLTINPGIDADQGSGNIILEID